MPGPDRVLVVDNSGRVYRQSTSDERLHDELDASRSRVWTALTRAYTLLGLQPTASERESGVYGNEGFDFPREFNGHSAEVYFSCGQDVMGPLVQRGRLVALVMSSLTSSTPTETRLTTHVAARLSRHEGTSSEAITCASTGRLEKELHESVRNLLVVP